MFLLQHESIGSHCSHQRPVGVAARVVHLRPGTGPWRREFDPLAAGRPWPHRAAQARRLPSGGRPAPTGGRPRGVDVMRPKDARLREAEGPIRLRRVAQHGGDVRPCWRRHAKTACCQHGLHLALPLRKIGVWSPKNSPDESRDQGQRNDSMDFHMLMRWHVEDVAAPRGRGRHYPPEVRKSA